MKNQNYNEFLRSKVCVASQTGFDIKQEDLHPALLPHQKAAVQWALKGGRRALFESFGLGKTLQELEFCRQVVMHKGGRALIVLPLGVKQEFTRDAVNLLGMAMVAQRARGVISSVYAGRGERTSRIGDRKIHCNPEWVMSWRSSFHHCESEILDDGAWKKVKESIPAGEREVWSIQVADDASYTAEGCIVKNCPLQTDIVERIINRYSNPGDLVLDPFGGLMTVPLYAIKAGRRGYGIELNPDYFRDGVGYLQQEEKQVKQFTLFDLLGGSAEEAAV